MPDYDRLPRWLRVIGRSLRIGGYLFLVVVGVGDLRYTPADFGAWQAAGAVIGGGLLVLGLMAALAVSRHLWRWEWTLAFWLAFLLGIRAFIVWSQPGPPPPLSDGGMVTFAATALVLRGLDLTVFAVRTSAWRWRLQRRRT